MSAPDDKSLGLHSPILLDVSAGGSCEQAQDLIIEITSLEKEVTNLEQHVLSLYRNILDQKLSHRASGKPSDPYNPCSPSAAKDHAAPSRESRFKAEESSEIPLFPPASPQHRRHGSAAAQGYKRPHSAISADRQFKTRHGSLLSGAFYSIDEEPCADQGFSTSISMVRTFVVSYSLSYMKYSTGLHVLLVEFHVLLTFAKSAWL